MSITTKLKGRVFKTTWFSKAAKKAHIGDAELCAAIKQVMLGQADDLGGGVFKKRLNDNIENDELVQFRALAKSYATLSEMQIEQLIDGNHLKEICHDH
jgi:hypothetical protein